MTKQVVNFCLNKWTAEHLDEILDDYERGLHKQIDRINLKIQRVGAVKDELDETEKGVFADDKDPPAG